MARALSWIEIDTRAIADNLRAFRAQLRDSQLMAVVKGEAYGHGMLPVARAALDAGADWLGTFNLHEALELCRAGLAEVPVLVLGYVPISDLAEAIDHGIRITVSSPETAEAAGRIASEQASRAFLHLKLETGTHRLGLEGAALERTLAVIEKIPQLVLEGAHTHFANIEDTTEHDYARMQLERFEQQLAAIRQAGHELRQPHTACTAAAILFPRTHFAMVRVGIGMYGLWPSKETFLSALQENKPAPALRPALTWKTRVAQVKRVPAGAYVGYGCTYRCTRETLLAILPVGYANGYDRLLSNRGHVLIGGLRAPIRGRVCMNLTMVDVTDVPSVSLEDEVVLLGEQGDEKITAELMASWAQTINYEVVTRADPYAPRRVLGPDGRVEAYLPRPGAMLPGSDP
ncbi:MAG: alanine racemase [Deltaproteobacteria bacterium]|nr:alanine racemase [Deltaproteobacteria bacterium]